MNSINRNILNSQLFTLLVVLLSTNCIPPSEYYTNHRFPNQKQIEFKRYAKSFVGTPYRYGGLDKSGIDCSGLVVKIFRDVYGIRLPHSTKSLIKKGKSVPDKYLETGDLLFFKDTGYVRPNHVGIYLGNNQFIHASSTKGVIVTSLGINLKCCTACTNKERKDNCYKQFCNK